MEAFQKFSETHPEAVLFMHVRATGCENIIEILDYLKMPEGKVILSDQKKMERGCFTFDHVVKLYKMADVLLNATCSEGYSCVGPEIQALGGPVIVSDTTAMPDNLYNGEKAKTYQRKFVFQNVSYWYVPDMLSILECLNKIYNRSPQEKRDKSRYGVKMIRENYTMRTLYDGMETYIRVRCCPMDLLSSLTNSSVVSLLDIVAVVPFLLTSALYRKIVVKNYWI